MGSNSPTDVSVSVSTDTPVLVAIARLEGKLDANLARVEGKVDGQATDLADHEARMRVQEARRTVSPGQLWAGLVGVLGVGVATLTIVNGIVSLVNP